jgi:hypothetical protein
VLNELKHIGEWRYSSTILDLGTKMEVSGQLHVPAASTPHGRKNPQYPLDRRLGGPQSCGCGQQILARVGNKTPAIQPITRRYTD